MYFISVGKNKNGNRKTYFMQECGAPVNLNGQTLHPTLST